MDIIEPFYQKYKKILSEARITENANLIYKYVDRTIFHKFKTLISNILLQVKDMINNSEELIYSTTFLTKEQIECSKKW